MEMIRFHEMFANTMFSTNLYIIRQQCQQQNQQDFDRLDSDKQR